MSGLSYEQVARFAQQVGTLYFVVIFLAGVVYALWPKNRQAFRDMAHLPLREDEDDHVGS
jgi:cytochrome c oxidase cbb3-type subunit 4